MALGDHRVFHDAHVEPSIRSDLHLIQDFLSDDHEVKAGLDILDRNLQIATGGGTPEQRLWREFQRMESRSLFKPIIAVITKELDAPRFVKALQRRHPLKDIGAGANHGEYSHRLQWYLILQRYFEQGVRKLHLSNAPSTLYAFLGSERFTNPDPNADHPSTLWAALVDTFHDNATSPEWLNMNVCGLDSDVGNVNWTFGTLRAAFRDRYRFREDNGFVATKFSGGPRDDAKDIDEMYTRELEPDDRERVQTEGSGPSADWKPWQEISV